MSSGAKRMVINTQERAISPDINRLQSFAARVPAEFFRYLMDVSGNDDLDAGAIITEYSTLGTPLRAEIANGLLVKPQIGSLDLLIDPGVLYAIAPDGDADSSVYKFIKSAGIAAPALLAMTPNPAGSARIDVIECSINPSVVTETDNRDIFNPSTGLFTPTSVTKVSEDQLTFRVRAGVAGTGYPAAVAGWLPLAVASLPAGTVSNDTITFWDVRPVLSDRALPGNLSLDYPPPLETNGWLDSVAGPVSTLTGHTTCVDDSGRRLGGRLRRGSPGVDADTVVLTDTANADPTIVVAVQKLVYLYLLTPFGLPRWARYTDFGSGVRKPRSPRGIPLVSRVPPNEMGLPSAPVTFPAVFGFGAATTTSGYCFGSTLMLAGAGYSSTSFSDRTVFNTKSPNFDFVTGVLIAGLDYKFTLTPGLHFPTNAKQILAVPGYKRLVGATSYESWFINAAVYRGPYGAAAAAYKFFWGEGELVNVTGAPINTVAPCSPVWINIPQNYPSGVLATLDIVLSFNGVPSFGPFLTISGYRT